MTTPEDALQAARRFVAQNRPGCHVEGLLEDDRDYLALLELDDPDGAWPLGPGPVFVSKASGMVWTDAYGNVLDKIDGMRHWLGTGGRP